MIGPSQTDVWPGAVLRPGFVPDGRARMTHGVLGRVDTGTSMLNVPLEASTPLWNACAPPFGKTQSTLTSVPVPVAVPAMCSVVDDAASLLLSGCDRFAGSITCVAVKSADAGPANASAATMVPVATSVRLTRTTLCTGLRCAQVPRPRNVESLLTNLRDRTRGGVAQASDRGAGPQAQEVVSV